MGPKKPSKSLVSPPHAQKPPTKTSKTTTSNKKPPSSNNNTKKKKDFRSSIPNNEVNETYQSELYQQQLYQQELEREREKQQELERLKEQEKQQRLVRLKEQEEDNLRKETELREAKLREAKLKEEEQLELKKKKQQENNERIRIAQEKEEETTRLLKEKEEETTRLLKEKEEETTRLLKEKEDQLKKLEEDAKIAKEKENARIAKENARIAKEKADAIIAKEKEDARIAQEKKEIGLIEDLTIKIKYADNDETIYNSLKELNNKLNTGGGGRTYQGGTLLEESARQAVDFMNSHPPNTEDLTEQSVNALKIINGSIPLGNASGELNDIITKLNVKIDVDKQIKSTSQYTEFQKLKRKIKEDQTKIQKLNTQTDTKRTELVRKKREEQLVTNYQNKLKKDSDKVDKQKSLAEFVNDIILSETNAVVDINIELMEHENDNVFVVVDKLKINEKELPDDLIQDAILEMLNPDSILAKKYGGKYREKDILIKKHKTMKKRR